MKKIGLVLVVMGLFVNVRVNGQAPNWVWARGGTGTGGQEGLSCAADGQGNVYATGFYTSPVMNFGSIAITNTGSFNIFFVKYSSTGNVLWAKNIGGVSSADYGSYITTDASNNVYLTGFFMGNNIIFDNDTLIGVAGKYRTFIAKYSPAGTVLWAKCTGGDCNSLAYCVATDVSGDAFVTGYFWGNPIIFGNDTLTNLTGSDMFIVKYSSTGTVMWARCAGGIGTSHGWSVSTDALGNCYVTGDFGAPYITFNTDTLTCTGDGNMFITKGEFYKLNC
jgi:hypothetical protein